MSYDRNNISKTTEDGINDLVNDIIGGFVSLDQAFTEIKFKPLQKKISNALELKDNEDWEIATSEDSVESYSNYLSLYDRDEPWYMGKHVAEAKSILSKLSKSIEDIDEEAWNKALSEDTMEGYESYLSVYDKSAPDYAGKYVDDAKSALRLKSLTEQDNRDWQAALSENTGKGYGTYLSKYNNVDDDYVGLHVADALSALDVLQKARNEKERADKEISECKSAWETAQSINSLQAYQDFIRRFDSLEFEDAQTLIAQAKNQILSLQDDEDWMLARKTNTQKGYDQYIEKYWPLKSEYQGKYLDKAKSWIPGQPNPRYKHIILACVAVALIGVVLWNFLIKDKDQIKEELSAAENYRLGMIYLNKENYDESLDTDTLPIDFISAIKYFEKAASENHIEAIKELGCIYKSDYFNDMPGLVLDGNKSLDYFSKAIALGDSTSYGECIEIYYIGNGIWDAGQGKQNDRIKNLSKNGINYIWIAPDKLNYNLGVARDYSKAKEYAYKAGGNALLGFFAEFGISQKKSFDEALAHYERLDDSLKERYIELLISTFFSEPKHLGLACKYGKQRCFFTYDELYSLNRHIKNRLDTLGLYVSGFGEGKADSSSNFILKLRDEIFYKITWIDAKDRYGSHLPPYPISWWHVIEDINPALVKFGGAPLIDTEYWSAKNDNDIAWLFFPHEGIGTPKNWTANVRLVEYF